MTGHKATYQVPFDDFNYDAMAHACGLYNVTLELRRGNPNGHLLHVEGSQAAIDDFTNDLSWGPTIVDDTPPLLEDVLA